MELIFLILYFTRYIKTLRRPTSNWLSIIRSRIRI